MAQPAAAEDVGLVDHRLGVIQLAVGGGEEAMPEQGNLLFQRPPGIDDAVHPVGLGALYEH